MVGGLLNASLWMALFGGGDDRVVLETGQELRGRVVYEDQHSIVLRLREKDLEIDRSEVTRLSSDVRELADLLSNDAQMGSSADALEFLSEQARECGLDGEERLFLWRRLQLDPDDEDLNRRLGHRKSGAGWLVPMGGRSVPIARRIQLSEAWSTAWEFSSLHYRVRSNLSLEATLAIVLDLERLYLALYGLFGEELRLYEICTPMNVALHADHASYPENGAESGYYEFETDTIHVDVSQNFSWALLAHEATHQVLQNALLLERARTDSLTPWLNEGLAEYTAAGVRHPGNVLEFEPEALNLAHFRLQASTPTRKRIDLGRVLTLGSGDFRATSQQQLKYAEAYTLVHFLLHGEERRYREGMIRFMQGQARAKRSSTDLKKALDLSSWRGLEKEWSAYVERLGR